MTRIEIEKAIKRIEDALKQGNNGLLEVEYLNGSRAWIDAGTAIDALNQNKLCWVHTDAEKAQANGNGHMVDLINGLLEK